MKKFLITVFILALLSLSVFVAGWTPLYVPRGSIGIVTSKTGGVDPSPVVPGEFAWHWERLIPTNARTISFAINPATKEITVTGELPDASRYSAYLGGTDDFSWEVSVSITAKVLPSTLPGLVSERAITDQTSLDAWVDTAMQKLAEGAVRSVARATIVSSLSDGAAEWNADSMGQVIAERLRGTQEGLAIASASVTPRKIPDLSLYASAVRTRALYEKKQEELLARTADRESDEAFAEYLQTERLTRLGEVLTKYPILIDYLAVMKSEESEAFKKLRPYR
jgi:hypothetical protein